ncbi:MAG: hypothetical protein Q7J16_10705 [Candidatus Cloacimonadales bacterium]|nr:hypothetical protein [Candidatus Cloacimonadales bacterium]
MEFTYSGNINITVTINANSTVTLEPAENWPGSEEIYFHANQLGDYTRESRNSGRENFRGMTTDTLHVTVEPLNDPPVVEDPIADFSFPEDTSCNDLNLDSVFSDPDFDYGDTLTLTYSGNTECTVDITDITVTFGASEAIASATADVIRRRDTLNENDPNFPSDEEIEILIEKLGE